MITNSTDSIILRTVPDVAAMEMGRLYQHVFSSVEQLMAYGSLDGETGAYIERDAERITAMLLFRPEGETLRILNEQIPLDADVVTRCAGRLFADMPQISVIRFHAIRAAFSTLPFPFQRFDCSEDIVVSLSDTVDAYQARLGKATRKSLKNKLNRLIRDFPSLGIGVYEKDEVDEEHIRAIIGFNRHRMTVKHAVSYIDEEETARMIARVRACGWVVVVTIDGKVCAGSICSRIGDHFFTHISSYDVAYDAYRLGTLCCYLTVCESIRHGGKEFHFLWGRNEYTFLLLGEMRQLSSVAVYRSHARLLRHGGMALQMAFDGYKRMAKFRILALSAQRDSKALPARIAVHAVDALRRLKHSMTPQGDGNLL